MAGVKTGSPMRSTLPNLCLKIIISPPIDGGRRNASPLNLKISVDIMCVINGDLALPVAELFSSLLTGLVLRTFVAYSVTFCNRFEGAI